MEKPNFIHCLCNHLSSFGADFFVAPNTIDFKKAVKELSQIDETGNVVVLVVVSLIFVLYCIMLMVVKRMDKSDLRKVCGIIVTNKNNKK